MKRKYKAAVREWVELHMPKCLVCGSRRLGAADAVDLPYSRQPSPPHVVVTSVALIVCTACGHVTLVDAVRLGLERSDYAA